MELATKQWVPDVIPEHYPYQDTGCDVSPSCLHCPLPQCKYDDPGWLRREQQQQRDQQVLAALQGHRLSVPEAATRFDLSQRTVFRILKRAGPTPYPRPEPRRG